MARLAFCGRINYFGPVVQGVGVALPPDVLILAKSNKVAVAFAKGQSGNPRGRKPGTVINSTRVAKEAFALAFEGIGGVQALSRWAKKNPTEFFKLYARLIPVELAGKVEHDATLEIVRTVVHKAVNT